MTPSPFTPSELAGFATLPLVVLYRFLLQQEKLLLWGFRHRAELRPAVRVHARRVRQVRQLIDSRHEREFTAVCA